MNGSRLLNFLAVFALAVGLGACDQDLTEINENPNAPETVPVESVLSSGIWDMVANAPGRGTHGEWTTMYHTALWPQHLAQSAYNEEDNYTPREGINENIWEEAYSGALQDLKRTGEIATEQGDDNLHAVSEIMQVYGFLFLTDLFGDIPYAQALNLEEYPNPEFSLQEDIYPDLIARLQAAAGEIDTSEDDPDWASGDLIYQGDMDLWQKFANSLILRVAMRTSNTGYATEAGSAFQTAWNANRFTSNADMAALNWTGNLPSQNPIYENLVLGGRDGDFRVSASLVDTMDVLNDPRLPIYANPAVSDDVIRGLPNGNLPSELGNTVNDYSTLGDAFVAADAPSVLMSYAEVLLLGAEAAELGWIAGGSATAATHYADGIEASMLEHGVASGDITTYLGQPSVVYTDVSDIHFQKWLAVYMAGPEVFAEVRRTGVPDLPLPAQAVIDQMPTRLPYPANEGLYNPNFADYANVTYTEPLWWMP